MDSPEARQRVLRYVKHRYSAWEMIDVTGGKEHGFGYKVPGTQRPAEFIDLKIVRWRSETEVEMEMTSGQGPLAGGGGVFVMVKDHRGWSWGEMIETSVR